MFNCFPYTDSLTDWEYEFKPNFNPSVTLMNISRSVLIDEAYFI